MEFISVIIGNNKGTGTASNKSVLGEKGDSNEEGCLERGMEIKSDGDMYDDDRAVSRDGSDRVSELWADSNASTVGDALQFITQNLQVQMRESMQAMDLKFERTNQVSRLVSLEQTVRERIMQRLQMSLKMVVNNLKSNRTGRNTQLHESAFQEHSNKPSIPSVITHDCSPISSSSPTSSTQSSASTSSTVIHDLSHRKRKFGDAFCTRVNEELELVQYTLDPNFEVSAVRFPHPPSPRVVPSLPSRCSINPWAIRRRLLEDRDGSAHPRNNFTGRMSRPRFRSQIAPAWEVCRRSNTVCKPSCEAKSKEEHRPAEDCSVSYRTSRLPRPRERWSSFSTCSTASPTPRRLPSVSPPPARDRSARRVRARDIIGRNLVRVVEAARVDDMAKLLDAGADVDFTTAGGWVLLHRAARKAHVETLSLLLERGANVHARTTYGFTALHIAAYNDPSGWCATLLVAAGSDVNCANNSGRTPLHSAAEASNAKTILVLLEAGAEKTAVNHDGKQPYQVARNEVIRCMLK